MQESRARPGWTEIAGFGRACCTVAVLRGTEGCASERMHKKKLAYGRSMKVVECIKEAGPGQPLRMRFWRLTLCKPHISPIQEMAPSPITRSRASDSAV